MIFDAANFRINLEHVISFTFRLCSDHMYNVAFTTTKGLVETRLTDYELNDLNVKFFRLGK